jgi:DNA polymerase-3 subunit gamma/tau
VAETETERQSQAQAEPSPPAGRPSRQTERPSSRAERPSLYRRHRPRTFAEVVGQDAVVRTLRNAVARGQVHHAYLFVGSRGTGKTSMAKILAACLNCERGPTIEPCGECESCCAIAAARSLDVIEMDAASNNSVDDIRELRDSVAFAPVSGRSKVYILDEAHMLSTAAWNAFLKTLEEPPPNTVFVLATTEAQKVPATVVDRCHRFDFQRPAVEQIAQVLRRAAAAEAIAIPPEAVAALARSATGSFRDALGTLEQLVTYSASAGTAPGAQKGDAPGGAQDGTPGSEPGGAEIALADVLAVLGATDAQLLEETIDAVQRGDARAALLAIARCAEQGRDAGAFAADLEVRARELLVVGTLGELPAELALTPEADARLLAQAGRVQQGTAVRLLEQLAAALEAAKAGADPRTQLELALVKAARPEVEVSVRALLTRIERLEAAAPAAAPAPAGPVGVGPPPAAPAAFAAASARAVASAPAPAPAPAVEQAPPPAPEPVLAPAVSAPAVSAPAAPGEAVAAPPPPPAATPAGEQPPAQPVARAGAATDVEAFAALWPAVVELVGAENKMLSAVLADARPVAVGEGELRVAFAASASFLKKKAEDAAHRATVTEALRELSGDRRVRVEYELREELPPAAADEDGARQPRTEEEWVARFVEELDAEELPAEWAPPGAAEPQRT